LGARGTGGIEKQIIRLSARRRAELKREDARLGRQEFYSFEVNRVVSWAVGIDLKKKTPRNIGEERHAKRVVGGKTEEGRGQVCQGKCSMYFSPRWGTSKPSERLETIKAGRKHGDPQLGRVFGKRRGTRGRGKEEGAREKDGRHGFDIRAHPDSTFLGRLSSEASPNLLWGRNHREHLCHKNLGTAMCKSGVPRRYHFPRKA